MMEFINTLWTFLPLNKQPPHVDRHYAEETEFSEWPVNSMYVPSVVTGAQVSDLTAGTTVASPGFEEMYLTRTVPIGDTSCTGIKTIDKPKSDSYDDSGGVTVEHIDKNQDSDVICSCTRVALGKDSLEEADLNI
jgi:acyl dehydratase